MRAPIFATLFAMLHMVAIAAPLKGDELPAQTDGKEPLNEPCYVHDAACEGYPVCCVTKGTCISQHSGTISSNVAYYEGGCQDLTSRTKEWKNPDCKQQGECVVQHLHVCKGGMAKEGEMTKVPEATLERLMGKSCGKSCPAARYGHSRAPDGTTTTTTTVLTQVKAHLMLTVDGKHDDMKAAMEIGLPTVTAAAVGMPSVGENGPAKISITDMPAKAEGDITVEVTVDVSSSDKWTAEDVKKAITGLKSSKMSELNDVLAMAVGTCTGMKVKLTGVCLASDTSCASKGESKAPSPGGPAQSKAPSPGSPAPSAGADSEVGSAKMMTLMPAAVIMVATALSS